MARLYIVRHGEPTGSWGVSHDPDPGLSDLGKQQAQTAAERLRLLTPKRIVTSPLRRARETSDPLVGMLGQQAIVAPPVAEVPTPPGVAIEERITAVKEAVAPWSRGTPYLNFAERRVAIGDAIGEEAYARLEAVKASVDPDGRFRSGHALAGPSKAVAEPLAA